MSAEQFDVLLTNSFGALAGAFLHKTNINNLHEPAPVRDETLSLQLNCNAAHTCASHTHHLRHKFLGERKLGPDEVVHPNKPFAHPLLYAV
jgi:hypothetical protein